MLRNAAVDLSQPNDSMTIADASLHQEVRGMTDSLLGPKTYIRVGARNIDTMSEPSKAAQVIREMRRYKLDILGTSECLWTGSGLRGNGDGSVINCIRAMAVNICMA